MIQLMHGDCLERLRELGPNSVDAIVTDPPYGFGFMGKSWDASTPAREVFDECLATLKPGGHLLAFGGARTYHRLACAVEDVGFEIRDQIMWVYGSGFPKSLNVSKAIDKAAGAERTEVIGTKLGRPGMAKDGSNQSFDGSVNTYGSGGVLSTDITAPATDAAKQWDGWGTALKPAHEPIVVARKPFKGTVAANVLEHGTGALNIDGCRVGTETVEQHRKPQKTWREREGRTDIPPSADYSITTTQGRWPANLIHDGSDEVVGLFPEAKAGVAVRRNSGGKNCHSDKDKPPMEDMGYGDTGSAARFFYCAKASKRDRGADNVHPTVKPCDLMRYLCRLVTPPGGIVLDPFMGSGSTGKAALLEGFGFIGIELDPEYFAIAERRIAEAQQAVA